MCYKQTYRFGPGLLRFAFVSKLNRIFAGGATFATITLDGYFAKGVQGDVNRGRIAVGGRAICTQSLRASTDRDASWGAQEGSALVRAFGAGSHGEAKGGGEENSDAEEHGGVKSLEKDVKKLAEDCEQDAMQLVHSRGECVCESVCTRESDMYVGSCNRIRVEAVQKARVPFNVPVDNISKRSYRSPWTTERRLV